MDKEMEQRMYRIEEQEVSVDWLSLPGRALDIGGGGEGIIGRQLGQDVVTIDLMAEELEEAPEGPLKIVMDARDLKFLDSSFQHVLSFFSFMYMEYGERNKVFREIYRVLKPGGIFYLWDVTIPKSTGSEKDIFVIPLKVTTREGVIKTGYGVYWPQHHQDMLSLENMGRDAGLDVIERQVQGQTFHLQFQK